MSHVRIGIFIPQYCIRRSILLSTVFCYLVAWPRQSQFVVMWDVNFLNRLFVFLVVLSSIKSLLCLASASIPLLTFINLRYMYLYCRISGQVWSVVACCNFNEHTSSVSSCTITFKYTDTYLSYKRCVCIIPPVDRIHAMYWRAVFCMHSAMRIV